MLKVAIVGCGKVADVHAEHIVYTPDCKIVAVCDREELMARQLQERLQIPDSFTDLEELLKKAKPDVVHITTPPQSHYALGKLCLEAGCCVYIEKPFTVNADEAVELIGLAERKNLKLTVGHNQQFSHAARRMRQLVAEGYLGGPPVHVESYDGYQLGEASSYAKAMLGDHNHWVRKLPGGLLQNNMSHGISKIAEFLHSDSPTVIAHGFTSAFLQSIGETEVIDELRVIINDGGLTAYYTFSTQMRPVLEQLRVYGCENALVVDTVQQTVIKIKGSPYKSYLEQFLPPWNYAKQYVANATGNMKKFLRADFHNDHGKKTLIQTFYRSITQGTPVPIPYREILVTSRIMDEIFSQLNSVQDSKVDRHSRELLAESR
jgi:predicted dehydrogenase